MASPPSGNKKVPSPGAFARTDDSITVEYPEEGELPSSAPVTGRGGMHMKRTLASFSLEGKVGVVTGGARGLGLVMGQGMVISGANLAIVDMNSELSLVFPLFLLARRKPVGMRPNSQLTSLNCALNSTRLSSIHAIISSSTLSIRK
jgi:NAD(P)-dependent dehydrogenase (short-subunit alcohol dehydrogenase family)